MPNKKITTKWNHNLHFNLITIFGANIPYIPLIIIEINKYSHNVFPLIIEFHLKIYNKPQTYNFNSNQLLIIYVHNQQNIRNILKC